MSTAFTWKLNHPQEYTFFFLAVLVFVGAHGALCCSAGFLQLPSAGAIRWLWYTGFSLCWLLLLRSTHVPCIDRQILTTGPPGKSPQKDMSNYCSFMLCFDLIATPPSLVFSLKSCLGYTHAFIFLINFRISAFNSLFNNPTGILIGII